MVNNPYYDGIEHIILLSHLGFPRDLPTPSAQEVDVISLIVGQPHCKVISAHLADEHPVW